MPFGLRRSSAWRHADGYARRPDPGGLPQVRHGAVSLPAHAIRPIAGRAPGPRADGSAPGDRISAASPVLHDAIVSGCMASDLWRIACGWLRPSRPGAVQSKIAYLLAYSPRMRTDGDAPWGATREWRRKPLKLLKTDSAVPTRPEIILGGLEAQPRWLAPRALPRRPSRLAHWSLGGARTRCFRLLPCVRERRGRALLLASVRGLCS